MFALALLRQIIVNNNKSLFLISSAKVLCAVGSSRSYAKKAFVKLPTQKKNSEWWIVDGEMHEIGDDVPPRERFHIPRDNIPNRKRKQMRSQFMRKTRLNLKESDHETWCKQYMELFQELREDWEKLYWDEGYSKKVAQEHAAHDSEEDDDADFSPNRRRAFQPAQMKAGVDVYNRLNYNQGKISYLRDRLEREQEKRLRDRAFAPMDSERSFNRHQERDLNSHHDRGFNPYQERGFNQHQGRFPSPQQGYPRNEPLNIKRFFNDRS